MCFLLVEDHEFQRRALRRALSEIGARNIVEAAGGRDALDVFQDLTQPLDVIVTDINMPDGDGMELLRRIGESGAPASVILVSALDPAIVASVQRMASAYGVRILGSLDKPVRLQVLRELVERHRDAAPGPVRHAAEAFPFTRDQLAAGIAAGQFFPLYQPIVTVAGGRLRAAEALVRWRHPERGVLAPGLFIDAVERQGLVDELTWSVLRQAARDCRRWRRCGVEAKVSVNLSALSLGDPDAAERLSRIVAQEDAEARHVIFEMTESAATTELGHTLENIARLRLRGFEIAVDDYGTGYASMQQLARFPFTRLKIDRSFVHGAARDRRLAVLLQNSIRMADELGMQCVAEGVEDAEDWRMLVSSGCYAAQGYFVAKPMTAGALLTWAGSWRLPVLPARRAASA